MAACHQTFKKKKKKKKKKDYSQILRNFMSTARGQTDGGIRSNIHTSKYNYVQLAQFLQSGGNTRHVSAVLERQTCLNRESAIYRRIPSRRKPNRRPSFAGLIKKNLSRGQLGLPEDFFKTEAKQGAWLSRVD